MRAKLDSTARQSLGAAATDDLLLRVLAEYRALVDAGNPPQRDEFAARYPELGDSLMRCFESLDLLDNVGGFWSAQDRPGADLDRQQTLGDYRIARELGRGGMGIVYEAEQISLGRRVALKVLPLVAALDKRHLQRFKNEALAAASLDHPHIVHVYCVGCEHSMHFYTMQLVDGATLADIIRNLRTHTRQRPDEKGITTGERVAAISMAVFPTRGMPAHEADFAAVARIGIQAAEALEYAHERGIVHRDIKPSNLMLDEHGNLWVTDFGLAQIEAQTDLTLTGDIIGTLRYMSPEQALAQRGIVDHRSDIYSLGATLFELLTLRPMLEGDDRQELLQILADDRTRLLRPINPAVPQDLETILLKAVSFRPQDRYGTAQALADDLRCFLEHRPIRARRAPPWERLRKWSRRHLAVVWTALAFLFALSGILGLATISVTLERSRKNQALAAATAEFARAEQMRVRAESATQLAEQERDRVADLLYATDIRLAHQAWKSGDVRQAREILDRHVPRNGRKDARGLEWQLLDSYCRRANTTLSTFGEPIYTVRLTGDGHWVACAGAESLVRIFEAATGRLECALPTDQGEINGLAFSRDGQRLATTGDDGTVRVWNWREQKELFRIPAHPSLAFHVEYGPSDSLLVSCGEEPVIRLWDAQTGEPAGVLEGHEDGVDALDLSSDGRRLASAGKDCTARIWDVARREQMHVLDHDDRVTDVAFSHDSRELATTSLDRQVRVWDGETGSLLATIPNLDKLQCVSFTPDDRWLAIGDRGGVVRVWDTKSLRSSEPQFMWQAHEDRLHDLRFSPSGYRLFTASQDRRLIAWDNIDRQSVHVVQNFTSFFNGVDGCPGTDGVLVAGDEGVWYRDVASQRQFPTGDHTCWTVAAARVKGLVAATVGEGRLMMWDLKSGQFIRELGVSLRISEMAFSPDNRLLACGGWKDGKGVVVLDTDSWQPAHEASQRGECLAFSPDGRMLAVEEFPNQIVLWDTATWQIARTLAGHGDTVSALSFSPDSGLLASGANDRNVFVWDVDSGSVRYHLTGHRGDIRALTFSYDGRTLLSACNGGRLLLWHVPTGRQLFSPFDDASRAFRGLISDQPGKLVATTAHDLIFFFPRPAAAHTAPTF